MGVCSMCVQAKFVGEGMYGSKSVSEVRSLRCVCRWKSRVEGVCVCVCVGLAEHMGLQFIVV